MYCLLLMVAISLYAGAAQEQPTYPTFMPIPFWHLNHTEGEVFPECNCACCTAEKCPCQAGASECSEEVLCLTDKRDTCHEWVGENIEVSYCNIQRLWKQWRNINPHDDRFMSSRDRMKHDIFCRDFCAPEIKLPGAGCSMVPLPTPKPTVEPCPDHCKCDLFLQGTSFLQFRLRGVQQECENCCNMMSAAPTAEPSDTIPDLHEFPQ